MNSDVLLYEKREWLDRKECAAYICALGRPISVGRLANMASNLNRGKGPPYYRTGWSRIRYKPEEVARWVKGQITRVP